MCKTYFFYCLSFILTLSVLGCKKEEMLTTIKGRIIDIKTGQPIAGAVVYYITTSQVDGKTVPKNNIYKTSSNGEFTCSFYNLSIINLNKEGYLTKNLDKDIGYTNQYNYKYKLVPGGTFDFGDQGLYIKDGVFKVILKNLTGDYNEVIGSFSSDRSRAEQTSNSVSPLLLQPDGIKKGESVVQSYQINGDDWVRITWGYSNLLYYHTPFLDSFYVNKVDTAVYQINF